jgi:hypothetical protein
VSGRFKIVEWRRCLSTFLSWKMALGAWDSVMIQELLPTDMPHEPIAGYRMLWQIG